MFKYLERDYIFWRNKLPMGLECPYCEYQWIPRVVAPIECPRCKRHFTDNVLPGRVDVESSEWLRKLPEVKQVNIKSPNPYAYIQCAKCLEEEKDVEAIINIGGKSYCEKHADELYQTMKESYERRKLPPLGESEL